MNCLGGAILLESIYLADSTNRYMITCDNNTSITKKNFVDIQLVLIISRVLMNSHFNPLTYSYRLQGDRSLPSPNT